MLTVVTGATGHVGGNLVRALIAEGRQVRCVVWEKDDETAAIDGLDVERVTGDVRDLLSLQKAFEGADVVYHLASRISIVGAEGGLVRDINVNGARNVVEACLSCGVRRLVHFTSVHARNLARMDCAVDETREPCLCDAPAYDRSKAEAEKVILEGVAGVLTRSWLRRPAS